MTALTISADEMPAISVADSRAARSSPALSLKAAIVGLEAVVVDAYGFEPCVQMMSQHAPKGGSGECGERRYSAN